MPWEWIVVDDHSGDDTFEVMTSIAQRDGSVRAIRLARNQARTRPSPAACTTRPGDCAVVLAADLQDPPETLPALLDQWQAAPRWCGPCGCSGRAKPPAPWALPVCITYHAAGGGHPGYAGHRRRLLPAGPAGAGAFRQFHESNVSILALLTWMGFRQATITYDKQARLHGQSGWNLGKKLKLVVDWSPLSPTCPSG